MGQASAPRIKNRKSNSASTPETFPTVEILGTGQHLYKNYSSVLILIQTVISRMQSKSTFDIRPSAGKPDTGL